MLVSEAVLQRQSIRSFSNQVVSNKLIRELLEFASRSPSGGNLQPWKIFVINNSGYGLIKQTQDMWLGSRRVGVDESSGLAMPDLKNIMRSLMWAHSTMLLMKDLR